MFDFISLSLTYSPKKSNPRPLPTRLFDWKFDDVRLNVSLVDPSPLVSLFSWG